MLVLSRREAESIRLPQLDVEIRVMGLRKSKVQLGIIAPKEIMVSRGELSEQSRTTSYADVEHERLRSELAATRNRPACLGRNGVRKGPQRSDPYRWQGNRSGWRNQTLDAPRISIRNGTNLDLGIGKGSSRSDRSVANLSAQKN